MEKEKKEKPRRRFDIKKFLKLSLKHWYLYLISVVAVMSLASLYLMHKVDMVPVEAQVMLPQESASSSIMAEMARSFSFSDFIGSSTSTDNELDVMRSHTVFLNTVKSLGLNWTLSEKTGPLRWVPRHDKMPMVLTCAPEIADTIPVPLVFTIERNDNNTYNVKVKALKEIVYHAEGVQMPINLKTPYGAFTITPTEYLAKTKSKKFKIVFQSYHSAAEVYALLVKIFIPNKKSDFIGLSYTTNEPAFGIKLLSTLIEEYNKLGADQQNDRNSKTLSFVNDRIETLSKELAVTEHQIESFKATHKLTEPEVDTEALIKRSSTIENELLGAQTETEILGMTKQFISNPANNFSLIPSLASESGNSSYAAASDAISKYNELMLERMKIANSAKGNNQALRAIDDQIEAMRSNIITTVDRAYANSRIKLGEIQRENSNTSSRIGSYPAIEREYMGLKRVQLVQEQLYLFLLKQREETSMNMARVNATMLTIDQPHAIALVSGFSKKMILLLAFLIGLIIPAVFLFMRRYAGTSLSADEFAIQSDAPVAGCVGSIQNDDKILMKRDDVADSDDAHVAEMYRALRHNVQYVLQAAMGNTVLVTSTTEGEGKTTLACNLAASFGLMGKKTLLIDADLRNPQIAESLGIARGNGLLQVLDGDAAIPEIVTLPLHSRRSVDVLPAGGSSAISAELLGSKIMSQLMSELKEKYDIIVIDSTATRDSSDAFEVATQADMTLYVVRAGSTCGADIKFVNNLYADGRLPRIALAVNGADKPAFSVNETMIDLALEP